MVQKLVTLIESDFTSTSGFAHSKKLGYVLSHLQWVELPRL